MYNLIARHPSSDHFATAIQSHAIQCSQLLAQIEVLSCAERIIYRRDVIDDPREVLAACWQQRQETETILSTARKYSTCTASESSNCADGSHRKPLFQNSVVQFQLLSATRTNMLSPFAKSVVGCCHAVQLAVRGSAYPVESRSIPDNPCASLRL